MGSSEDAYCGIIAHAVLMGVAVRHVEVSCFSFLASRVVVHLPYSKVLHGWLASHSSSLRPRPILGIVCWSVIGYVSLLLLST